MPNPTVIFVNTDKFPDRKFPLGWTGVAWADPQSSVQEFAAIFLADNLALPELCHKNRGENEILLFVEHSTRRVDQGQLCSLKDIGIPRSVSKFSHEPDDPIYLAIRGSLSEEEPGDSIAKLLQELDENALFQFCTNCSVQLQIMLFTGKNELLSGDAPLCCKDEFADWNAELESQNGSPTTVLDMVISKSGSLNI